MLLIRELVKNNPILNFKDAKKELRNFALITARFIGE